MTKSINLAVQKNDPMECSNSSVAIAFQSAENASVSMHSLGQRKIRLSKSHLEQGDISLLPMDDFFSTEVVGGWDSDNAASRMLTAIFDGQAFETDIVRCSKQRSVTNSSSTELRSMFTPSGSRPRRQPRQR